MGRGAVRCIKGNPRGGETRNKTGINSPYERREEADFVADAGQESLEALVEKLLPVVLAAVDEAGGED